MKAHQLQTSIVMHQTLVGEHIFRVEIQGVHWSLEEKYYQINVKEMLTVYFSLKCFAKDLSILTLKINIDNTAVVSLLKKHGYIPQ